MEAQPLPQRGLESRKLQEQMTRFAELDIGGTETAERGAMRSSGSSTRVQLSH